MYFEKALNATDVQTEAISMKDISETADRFQFIVVPSTTEGEYYIIPKGYSEQFRDNKYFGL